MKVFKNSQSGGITILVALMLLVLLTIAAFAMSRNALREVLMTGTSRQGAQIRNLADAGVEWAVFWMANDPRNSRSAPEDSSGAAALRVQRDLQVSNLQTGVTSSAISHADMQISPAGQGPTQRFELFLTYMGNPRLKFTQSDVKASSISAPSQATVQLWSLRSDGYVEYPAGGPSFLHRREAWFTMPPPVEH